jgi:hypothetical protein
MTEELLLLLLLTATGLMPGGSVTKKCTYIQKMDIRSKEAKQTSHEKKQLISQNFTVQ